MESISVETDWDGLALSSLVATGRNNFSSSSLFVSELNSPNSSHSGASLFGIFPENGSTTTPHTLPQPRGRDLGLARAEIAVLGLVLALTTLGNSFVLWVLLRRRKHNAPMHVFMVNLCVADLVVALFQVSSWLTRDHYRNVKYESDSSLLALSKMTKMKVQPLKILPKWLLNKLLGSCSCHIISINLSSQEAASGLWVSNIMVVTFV